MVFIAAVALAFLLWHFVSAKVSQFDSERKARTFEDIQLPESFTHIMRLQHQLRLLKLYVQELERSATYSWQMFTLTMVTALNSFLLSFIPELPKGKHLACLLLMGLLIVLTWVADPLRADPKVKS